MKGEQRMFLHVFGVATLGKPALALGILASAYGAGNALVASEYRAPNPPAHETTRPQATPLPTRTFEHPTAAATLVPPAPKTEKPAPTAAPRTTKTTEPTTRPTTVSPATAS